MTIAEEEEVAATLRTVVDGGRLRALEGPGRARRASAPKGFEATVAGRPMSIALETARHQDRVAFVEIHVPTPEQPFVMRAGPEASALGVPLATTGDAPFDEAIRCYATNEEILRGTLDEETRARLVCELDHGSVVAFGPKGLVYRHAVRDHSKLHVTVLAPIVRSAIALAERATTAFQAAEQRASREGRASAWRSAQADARDRALGRRRSRRVRARVIALFVALLVMAAALVWLVGLR